MTPLGWWRGLRQAARFDLSIRLSLDLNLVLVPLLAVNGFPAELGSAVWAVTALIVVHVLLCIRLVHAGLDHARGLRPRPTRLVAAAAALAVAGTAGVYVAFPEPPPGPGEGPAVGVLTLLAGCTVVAAATAVPMRTTFALVAAGFAGTWALTFARDVPDVGVAYLFGFLLVAVALTSRVSTWMLGLVWELDRARQVQAELAVADERLRFARDLHDVVGRTLSVVALKAELAAQLARRGQDAAVDEMLEVRRVAQESLAEMRALVGGYRTADLDVELAGARSLLSAAGIACRTDGDGGGLPPPVHGTLGWAVREGATNVLRHSEARECTISVRPGRAGTVTLTMDNDGVRDGVAGQVRFGSGLVGLAERVAGLGGTVAADRRPGGFRLTVEVPLP